MAKRLIDADALIQEIERIFLKNFVLSKEPFIRDTFKAMFKRIDNAPTVDAVEVVHGVWKYKQTNSLFLWHLECSICGKDYHTQVGYNYCPNCGAKMDGGMVDE